MKACQKERETKKVKCATLFQTELKDIKKVIQASKNNINENLKNKMR